MIRSFVAFCLLTSCAVAAQPVEVAPDVYVIAGRFESGQQPDGNTVVLAGDDGLIVVDTGRHTAHVQSIVRFARERRANVAAIVNSHWHLDHTGGNASLRGSFPKLDVYSSPVVSDALQGFLARYRRDLENALAQSPPQVAAEGYRAELAILSNPDALLPDVPIERSGVRTIAGRELELYIERAATKGDLWLIDSKTKTVIAGDLVTLPAPFFDTACPARWRAALRRIGESRFDRLIPGHGTVMNREQFDIYDRAFGALLDCAASTSDAQVCIDGWMHNARELVPAEDIKLARTLLDYYFANTLRNASLQAELCSE